MKSEIVKVAAWQIHSEPNGYFLYYPQSGKQFNEPAIALVYKPEHAPIMAASPLLLDSLREMVKLLIQMGRFGGLNAGETVILNRAERAISEAESQII